MKRNGLISRVGFSAFSQFIASGLNFFWTIYFVSLLSPSDFGIYTMCVAFVLLYAGMGNALFFTQMVVSAPSWKAKDRSKNFGNTLLLASMASLLLFVLFWFFFLFIFFLYALNPDYLWLFSGGSFACLMHFVRLYFVSVSYSNRKEGPLLFINAAAVVPVGVLLLAQGFWGFEVKDPGGALFFYGWSALCSICVGIYIYRDLFKEIKIKEALSLARDFYPKGRWALGGVLATSIQNQGYNYFLAALVGPAAVGVANAARLIITPFNFLVPALTQMLLPRLAEFRETNRKKMIREGVIFSFGLASCALGYSLLMYFSLDSIIPRIINDQYDSKEVGSVMIIWFFVLIVQALRTGLGNIMMATQHFKILTVITILGGVSALCAIYPLTEVYGVQGAVFTVGVGELIMSVSFMIFVNKVRSA